MNKPKPRPWIAIVVYLALLSAAFLLIAYAGFSASVNMTIAFLVVTLSAGVSYATAKRRGK